VSYRLRIECHILICGLDLRIAGEIVTFDECGRRVKRSQTHYGLISRDRIVGTFQSTRRVNGDSDPVNPFDLPRANSDIPRGVVIVSSKDFFEHRVVCRCA
jgi:hypothetical protein